MKIKISCVVCIEKEVELFDEDIKQSMIEELCDSCVGQCMDSNVKYEFLDTLQPEDI